MSPRPLTSNRTYSLAPYTAVLRALGERLGDRKPARSDDCAPVVAGNGAVAGRVVRVLTTVPFDAGDHPARNRLVENRRDRDRLPVRAGLRRLVHHVPDRECADMTTSHII